MYQECNRPKRPWIPAVDKVSSLIVLPFPDSCEYVMMVCPGIVGGNESCCVAHTEDCIDRRLRVKSLYQQQNQSTTDYENMVPGFHVMESTKDIWLLHECIAVI